MSGAMMLAQAVGLLHVVVGLAGAVVAGLYLGRSRFAPLLLVGFATEAVVAVAYRVLPMVLGAAGRGVESWGAMYLVLTLVGVLAQAAIVAGVAGLLKDSVAPNPSSAP